MTVETVGKARRVRIYVNEDDKIGGKPLHLALLDFLRRENAHGATVIRATRTCCYTSRTGSATSRRP